MKNLIRTPIRTLLTFILLLLVMFAFTSRVAEFVTTNQEMNLAAKAYKGIGWAQISEAEAPNLSWPDYIQADSRVPKSSRIDVPRYQPLTMNQIASVLKMPNVTSSDLRFMTAGVSDRFNRLDEGRDYYNYGNRYIVEATLTDVAYEIHSNNLTLNALTLTDSVVLAGNPKDLPENKVIEVQSLSTKIPKGGFGGIKSPIRATIIYDDTYRYDSDYIKKHALGKRYAFVLRYEPSVLGAFYLGDHLTNSWCEAIQPIDNQPTNYLKLDAYKALSELIDLTNSDVKTFDVVYTQDMGSIRRFNEGKMHMVEGRSITPEDHLDKANVCVVSSTFASTNGVRLGDTLAFNLGTQLFETYKGLGAIAGTRERYKEAVVPVELAIVGIYEDIDEKNAQLNNPNWSYSINTVFVPKWLLPCSESVQKAHLFSPSEFSFVIDDAWDISSFLNEMKRWHIPKNNNGLQLTLQDNGWVAMADNFKEYKNISISTIAMLCLSIVVVTYFIVFTYMGRKKKEFAIMRALGTPKHQASKTLCMPLMLVALSSFVFGCFFAVSYSAKPIAENQVISGIQGNVHAYPSGDSRQWLIALGCFVAGSALILLFTLWELKKLSKLSPLALLQDHSTGHKKPRKTESVIEEQPLKQVPLSFSKLETPHTKSKLYIFRYIRRRLFRTSVKSILFVMLTALLLGAMGQFLVMYDSNQVLHNQTVIKANFLGGLPLQDIITIVDKGFGKDAYYEYTHSATTTYALTDIAVTNDIGRYIGETPDIRFATGYDSSSLKALGDVCFVGKQYMAQNDLKIGSLINMARLTKLKEFQAERLYIYKIQHRDDKIKISDEEILSKYEDDIEEKLKDVAVYYRIGGMVTSPSGKYDNVVYMLGTTYTQPIFDFEVPLDYVELTIADNFLIDEFRDYANSMATNDIKFVMDTSKIEKIKSTLATFDALYPLLFLLPILIGGLLGLLMIFNNSKEISVLRLLGTRKRATTTIFTIEQLILCSLGLLLGVSVLYIYNGSAVDAIALNLLWLFTAYFCFSLICVLCSAVMISHRNVLTQLQDKE